MNFVKLYIGDYLRDTGTLTVAQHGAYVLMLLHHYATEQPLPQGRELHRLLRAESKADRDAIDSIAARFWTLQDGGLVNSRAAKEMERAEHQREVNRSVGKLGGRPKRTQTDSVTESKPNHNPNHSQTPEIPPVVPQGDEPARQEIPCPYGEIVGLYHECLPSLPRVRLMPASRQRALRKLWGWVLSSTRSDGQRRATSATEALQWIGRYFAQAAENDFLMGRTPRGAEHANWRPDIDFLMTDKGMRQVIERTQEAA